MKINDFEKKLMDICVGLRFPKPEVVNEGLISIKFRIHVRENTSIEIYFNEETQTMTSALIVEDKRVFG
ncbi:unnamed protein product, partial [marine sediment metagenome]